MNINQRSPSSLLAISRQTPGGLPAPCSSEGRPAEFHPPSVARPDELHAIHHFLDRRATLAPETRAAAARRLALAFGRLLGYPLDQVAAGPEAFLQWIVDKAARRQGV